MLIFTDTKHETKTEIMIVLSLIDANMVALVK